MNIGISEKQTALISDALKNAGVARAVMFGSRAKGNFRYNSDIDIAIFGEGVNLGALGVSLDELPLPYKFDVVHYEEINNQALREHIDRVGVEILPQ